MKITRMVRLAADLSPAVLKALKELGDSQGVSIAQALSRAFSTEAILVKACKSGAKVFQAGSGKLPELDFARP